MRIPFILIIVFVCLSITISAQYQRPFKVYKENNLFGLKDATEIVIVPPQYLDIKTSPFGVFAMRSENKKWAIFNSDGQQISAFIYDRMEQHFPSVIEVRQGSKIGLVAEDGQLLIPVEYEKISPVGKVILSKQAAENGLMEPINFEYRGAIVTKYDRRGFINKKGEIVLPVEHERLRATANFNLPNEYIDIVGLIISKEGKFGIVDEAGQMVLPIKYDYINALKPLGFGELRINNKKGLYNKKLDVVVEPTFDEIVLLNEQYFAGKAVDSWTIYSTENLEVIVSQVDGIYPFGNGYTRIKKGNKWSAFSPEGKVILPFDYSGVDPFGRNILLEKEGQRFIYNSNHELVPYDFSTVISWRNEKIKLQAAQKVGGKYGFINDDGQFVIAPIYDEVRGFFNGVAIVQKDNFYGFIDTEGAFIQPIEYEIPYLKEEPELLLVRRDGLYGYMNYAGKLIIDCRYESIGSFGKYMHAKRNGKWGWINEQDETVIAFEYDFIENYEADKNEFRYKKENEFGWINFQFQSKTANSLIEWADELESIDSTAKNIRVGSHYGLIYNAGDFIIPIEFETPIVFDTLKRAVVKKNGFWGAINFNGNTIVPFEYEEQFQFGDNGFACVKKNNSYGVIDDNGQIIVPIIHEEFIYTDYQYWVLRDGNKYGIADNRGQLMIPIEYDRIYPFIDSLALAKKGRKWGYVNQENEIVIPFEYQTLNSFINNRAIAQKGEFWGIINQENEVLLPFEYDFLSDDMMKYLFARKNGYWGFFIEDFQQIIPFQYNEILLFDGGLLRVRSNDKYGIYNLRGQLIVDVAYDELSINSNGDYIYACIDGRCGILDENGKKKTRFKFESIRWNDGNAEGLRNGKWQQIDLN